MRKNTKKGRSWGGLQIGNLSDRFNGLLRLPREALRSDDSTYLILLNQGF